MNGHQYARLNMFHGPKHKLLGNHAGQAAPAWKNVPAQGPRPVGKGKQAQLDTGSKIFLSSLPADVKEAEVEELFRKTIGPLRESFLVYNSQGKSKGMAVVTFMRSGDAALAKAKYDGKVVDGRRPLKIEIVTDGQTPGAGAVPPSTPSLLHRIGKVSVAKQPPTAVNGAPIQPRVQKPRPTQAIPHPGATVPLPPRRIRQKKGPKRIKKLQTAAATIYQLDKEMEDYRAAADVSVL